MLTHLSTAIALLFLLPPQQTPIVEWLSPTTYNTGKIVRDEPIQHVFEFKNISGDTLRLNNVRTTCGCTWPEWGGDPVPPDSTGTITVDYDAGDRGAFKKKLKVYFDKQRRAELLWIEGVTVKVP